MKDKGTSKVRCYDIEICYEVKGEGFPLVMIMGLGARSLVKFFSSFAF